MSTPVPPSSSRPLHQPSYLILAALLDGPLHGYAVVKAVTVLSGGRVKMTAGTLYGALERLLAEGLVEAGEELRVNGRVRRPYRLTNVGDARVVEEAERLHRSARTVRGRGVSTRPGLA